MMKGNTCLLVLTENVWLSEGLGALLPELDCRRIDFGICELPEDIKKAKRLIIAVDSKIFLRGGWSAFIALRSRAAPDTLVVWLAGKNMPDQIPLGGQVLRVPWDQDIKTLRRCLMILLQHPDSRRGCASPRSLTHTER